MWTSNWLALGLVVLTLPAAAAGTVYRWVDAAGQVHYSDSPQVGAKAVSVRAGAGIESPAAAESSAPETPAPGTATIAKLAPDAAACEKKKQDLASYKSAAKLSQRDALGKVHEFTPEERQKLLEITQGEIDQLCTQ